jgi:hypothetical protein
MLSILCDIYDIMRSVQIKEQYVVLMLILSEIKGTCFLNDAI